MKRRIAETDVGRAVSSYWGDLEFENFHEVQVDGYCWRADLVSRRGPEIIVTECKTALSMDVMAQAHRWLVTGYCNRAYVAVPWARNSDGRHFAREVLRRFGIGLLTVQWSGNGDNWIVEAFDGRLVRKTPLKEALTRRLGEHLQTGVIAGSSGGGYWTPFAETCRNVRDFVRGHPGASLKEVIDSTAHHYSTPATARACISKWAQSGRMNGVEARREGNRLAFYPVETKAGENVALLPRRRAHSIQTGGINK